jgi:hypothetical protein
MPTYEIQAPNGKTYRIDGPEGASDDDVRAEVLRQFPEAAGTSKAVAKQGDITATYDVPADATPEQIQALSREAIAKANPGAQFGDPSRDTVQINQPTVGQAMQDSATNLGANMLGAAAVPVDLASQFGDTVNDALLNTAAGIADPIVRQFSPRAADSIDAFAREQTARPAPTVNAMLDKSNPNRASAPSATYAEFMGGAAIPIPGGAAAPKFGYNALTKAAAPAAENAAAREIVVEGARAKIPVMTSDVKPPTTFVGKSAQTLGERIPFAGTGGPRAAQQEARQEAVKQLAQDYGAVGADGAIDDVAADLAKTRGEALTKHKATKKRIIENLAGEVPAPQTVAAIDKQIAELSKVDTDAARQVISKLENWRQALQVAGKDVNTGILDASGKPIVRRIPAQGKELKTIELIRKEMGDAFSGSGMENIRSTGEAALSNIYGPMRADMGNFIKAKGGESAYSAWKNANDQLAAMAGELKNARFKNVIRDAESTPENVASLLFSRKPSEVRRLYSNLSGEGRAKAQAALLHKALQESGVKTIDELDNVSPDKFVNAMQRYAKSTGIVFEGPDLARLDGLGRVLKATQRAATASVAPPTGVQNAIPVIGVGLGSMFGGVGGFAAGAGIGLIARVYESAAVRNSLLKLGRTKPGSPMEAKMLERAGVAITAVLERNPANDNIPMSPGMAAAQEPAPSGGEPPQQ